MITERSQKLKRWNAGMIPQWQAEENVPHEFPKLYNLRQGEGVHLQTAVLFSDG